MDLVSEDATTSVLDAAFSIRRLDQRGAFSVRRRSVLDAFINVDGLVSDFQCLDALINEA